MSVSDPLILAVAPNGARKVKSDHPAVPLSAQEIGQTAATCLDAGATMIHLHVRNADGSHSLDADLYRDAIAAVRQEAGPDLIIQVTSEAVGIYRPDQQRDMVRDVRPEAVSLAVRELIPTEDEVGPFAEFAEWMGRENVSPQYILYDAADVVRFADLQRRGIIVQDTPFILFVLGRYSKNQTSEPADLLPFLEAYDSEKLSMPWAVCAFGPKESACGLTAAGLGGHSRIGFENNVRLANGALAPDNAALIAQVADHAGLMGRDVADTNGARALLGMK